MTTVSNNSIVLRLIQKATENSDKGVMGKKALQKSIYFLSLSCSSFYFRWADYGPFSGEVQQIVQDLVSNKNILIRDVETKQPHMFIKKMTYVDGSSDFEDFPHVLDVALDGIVKFTAGKSPRELELLASVHFWTQRHHNSSNEHLAEYCHEKLTDLKPDAGFKISDVEQAIEKLVDNEFLEPVKQ